MLQSAKTCNFFLSHHLLSGLQQDLTPRGPLPTSPPPLTNQKSEKSESSLPISSKPPFPTFVPQSGSNVLKQSMPPPPLSMANQETLAQFTGHPMINQAQLAQQQALYHQQLLQVLRNSFFTFTHKVLSLNKE